MPFFIALLIFWAYSLALGVVVVILVRQVGLLNLRLGPKGARSVDGGPTIGDQIPEFTIESLGGLRVTIGGRDGIPTLVVFVSATCPVCRKLLPAVKTVSEDYSRSKLVLAGVGDKGLFEAMLKDFSWRTAWLIFEPTVTSTFRIPTTPYAVALDFQGTVVGKGIVNQIEHLEDLLALAEESRSQTGGDRTSSH